jgi:hypothetical protein
MTPYEEWVYVEQQRVLYTRIIDAASTGRHPNDETLLVKAKATLAGLTARGKQLRKVWAKGTRR